MTRTAKRRFARELQSIVDGIAFGPTGPVFVHMYDPPAGDVWMDDVIPGKLTALDRNTGEVAWMSPCEVGYGRGFGAGLGAEQDVVVLGPGSRGHLIVRMALADGKLLGASEIEAFDEAHVFKDIAITVTPRQVIAYDSRTLKENWQYSRSGERYHHVARIGNKIFVAYTHEANKKQGVLWLDVQNGEYQGDVLTPKLPVIHGLVVNGDGLVVLTRDLASVLPREVMPQFMVALSKKSEGRGDSLSLLALTLSSTPGEAPLWFDILSTAPKDELPDVSIASDSGKLYVANGALIEVRDTLTGRKLDEWAIPGLDESVAWQVSSGACLVAEESRASVFELPA
ncbi:MAG: PQQ-binding-like beta-propeller repeat protein [Planctomycetes bacterium]|nr:PQQ-binding-like beta-propeller repeat protein [Planctomycetota bacterium]